MDARISILGLYQWDQTIFDDMALPDTDFSLEYEDLYITPIPIDKETLKFSILSELSQFRVIYPDPSFMKLAITAWSRRKVWSWQKAYESFFYKYNPLWNKDGKVTTTDTETRDIETTGTKGNKLSTEISGTDGNTRTDNLTRTDDLTRTDNFTESGSESTTYGGNYTDSGTSGNTNTRRVSAYNDNTFQNAEEITDSGNTSLTHQTSGSDSTQTSGTNGGTSSDTGTVKNTGTVTDAGTHSETQTQTGSGTESGTESGTITTEHESYERGNIGVTMTQQLIEADRKLYLDNIYDMIIRDFKNEFCVMVY